LIEYDKDKNHLKAA